LLKDHSRKEASLFTCTMGSLLSSSYCKNISHEAFLLLSSQYCKTRSWNGPKPWTPLQKLTTRPRDLLRNATLIPMYLSGFK
jgi:hypothetical protein